MNEDKVIQKLIDHDKRFDQHDQKFDRIITKLLDHEKQIDRIRDEMATREDIGKVMVTLDNMSGILKRLDEERVVTSEWIKKVELVVETHTKEIKQLKQQLHVS